MLSRLLNALRYDLMFRLVYDYKMVKKCCIYGCTSNYESEKKKTGLYVPVYRFPKSTTEREKWIKSIPNANLRVNANTVVCELHWPPGFEAILVHGKVRPKYPPSVWPNIPASQVPTPAPVARSTSRSLSSVRNERSDEIALFHEMDAVDFLILTDTLLNKSRSFDVQFSSFCVDDILVVQSHDFFCGVPRFMVKIKKIYALKCSAME